MSLDLTGANELLARLRELGGTVTAAPVVTKMNENMADLEIAAVALAPIDEGDLIRSASHKVEVDGGSVVGMVGFSAQDENGYPYAVRQHEDLSLKPGPKTALKPSYDGETPGPKFLERPFNKYAQKYVDNLAEGLAQAIEEVAS
jgi:hypothetical protein